VITTRPTPPRWTPSPALMLASWMAATGLLAGCAEEPVATEPVRAPAELSTPLLIAEEKPEIGALDAFGNLKGSGEWILGFEVPEGAQRNPRAVAFPVVYVSANEQRVLRFYRSRGHTLIKKMSSWTVAHSHRTLDEDGGHPSKQRGATIVMSQGPGAGYTLRFHRSSPAPPKKRPVELLVEAERATPEARRGQKGGDSPASIKKLRAEAFHGGPDTRKAVDLSKRIYQHMKEQGSERFLD